MSIQKDYNLIKTNINNILFIIPVPLFPLGASNYSSYRIIKELIKIDYNITLICPEILKNYQADLEHFKKSHSINVLDQLRIGGQKGFLKHLRYIFYNRSILKLFIKNYETSLIHCFNPPDIIPLVASKLAKKNNTPFIFHIADPGPESMEAIFNGLKKKLFFILSSLIEKRALKRSSGVFTVNKFLREQIIKTRNISKCNFEVIYNIPNTDDVTVEEVKLINYSLIYVGTLHNVTGLDFFIENFKCLNDWKKTKLIIVGDGSQKEDLITISRNLSLEKNIIFKGHVDYHQAMQLLKSSTLAIIPYIDNPLTRVSLPTKLFEYIKLSKTVICPNLPGFTEILGFDNPGLYNINDKLGIYNIIQAFFDDKKLIKKTELLNLEIADRFTLEKETRTITDLYRQILN